MTWPYGGAVCSAAPTSTAICLPSCVQGQWPAPNWHVLAQGGEEDQAAHANGMIS